MGISLLTLAYLIGSVTFILGLKMLSHPDSARKGNLIAAAGMIIAIFGTIFLYESEGKKLGNYAWIFGGLLIGTIIGTLSAKKVKMTAMPEMVSLFNGMGGACAALISMVEFNHLQHQQFIVNGTSVGGGTLLAIVLGLIIGTISFAGSMVAWGKLNGKLKDFSFPGQHLINIGLLLVILSMAGFLVWKGGEVSSFYFYLILYSVLFMVFSSCCPLAVQTCRW
jgi:NAD(P) transhydrogenase subunit beta